MQGEKAESNEKLYFQYFARRKRLVQFSYFNPVFEVNLLLSMVCTRRGTIYRAPAVRPYPPAGIFSIPMYGRKTSGTKIDPSAC